MYQAGKKAANFLFSTNDYRDSEKCRIGSENLRLTNVRYKLQQLGESELVKRLNDIKVKVDEDHQSLPDLLKKLAPEIEDKLDRELEKIRAVNRLWKKARRKSLSLFEETIGMIDDKKKSFSRADKFLDCLAAINKIYCNNGDDARQLIDEKREKLKKLFGTAPADDFNYKMVKCLKRVSL